MVPDVFTHGTPAGDDEVPARVRLVKAGEFQVGDEGPFYTVWLELDGRQLAAGQFNVTPDDFAALNEALGGLPPRSKRGLRRWVADRIPFDVVTVRDRLGREWFRLGGARPGLIDAHPDEPKWSRLDYQGCWTEADLIFAAGPVVEVPEVTYAVPDGEREYVRTDRILEREGDHA